MAKIIPLRDQQENTRSFGPFLSAPRTMEEGATKERGIDWLDLRDFVPGESERAEVATKYGHLDWTGYVRPMEPADLFVPGYRSKGARSRKTIRLVSLALSSSISSLMFAGGLLSYSIGNLPSPLFFFSIGFPALGVAIGSFIALMEQGYHDE